MRPNKKENIWEEKENFSSIRKLSRGVSQPCLELASGKKLWNNLGTDP
jgi:hypothetical protein